MLDDKKWLKKVCAIFAVFFFLFAGTNVMAKQKAKAKASSATMEKLGTCTMPDGTLAPDITTQIKVTQLQGEWVVSMDTLGSNSVGSWFVNFTKDGEGEPSMQYEFNPPGGWSIVGGQVKIDKPNYRHKVSAMATKRSDPIIVCKAEIAITK